MERREFVQGVVAAGAITALGLRAEPAACAPSVKAGTVRLDSGWRFALQDAAGAEAVSFNDATWEAVTLPHTARIESLVTGPPGSPTYQWQGICWYRRTLRVEQRAANDRIWLKFDGAMNVADVWLDGRKIGQHLGGYLPFVIDVSDAVTPGSDHILAVRLDNRDNPITGPKPLEQLDFNMYHGLYRHVHLIRKNALHITDPILADRAGSGGVFVTYPKVTRAAATVTVQTHVRSTDARSRTFRVRATLLTLGGTMVSRVVSAPLTLQAGADTTVKQDINVQSPSRWSPAAPNLYTLKVEVVGNSGIDDVETTRIGIRRFDISPQGFSINGERLFLRGTNRHQEYPYVGYALSDAAQHRDARKIKDAGFDYIRLSHYAHAPAFMDACDELGIVVMNCIPGWQYFGKDPAFTELQYKNSRELMRRDRNHACVIMWEVSLNETGMSPEFIKNTHAIAHEEYPGDQCYTAGWTKGYDVFIQARQHGGCHKEGKDSTCVVSEYGDWEYYAMTAGLNQDAWEKLTPAESNSRQLRWQGERALLQQATNFQEAHNDNRSTVAFADGLWVMYDYNRGYAPDIESSGCMDIFRLPKFSYYFFKSQRPAAERLLNATSGPMVFIASHWTAQSARDIRVFSNCDEVALRLNGRVIARQRPDKGPLTTHLNQPPFTFRGLTFAPGALEAIGYIKGRLAARHSVRTPGQPERLQLSFDMSGKPLVTGAKDVVFCRASLVDAFNTVVPDAWENVAFGVRGPGTIVGMNPLATEAGISTAVLQTSGSVQPLTVYALALIPAKSGLRPVAASAALLGNAAVHEVRTRREGSRTIASLLVSGAEVVTLASDVPKYRVPVSAPPNEQRTPFHSS